MTLLWNCFDSLRCVLFRYDSDRVKDVTSEAAVNCICKGFVDGVKLSFQKDTLTNDRLYLLFERLKNHLYYENCSQQLDLIRILSVLITQVTFKDVFACFCCDLERLSSCFGSIFRYFTFSFREFKVDFRFFFLIDSTSLEAEIAKYIHSFVSSQLEIILPQYEAFKNRYLMLLSVDGLSDQIQSLLIKSYRVFVFLFVL